MEHEMIPQRLFNVVEGHKDRPNEKRKKTPKPKEEKKEVAMTGIRIERGNFIVRFD